MDIETTRLLLRNWRAEDFEPFARMNQDPVVMRYFPATLPVEESRKKAEGAAKVLTEQGWGIWAVELKTDAAFINARAIERELRARGIGEGHPDWDKAFHVTQETVMAVAQRVARAQLHGGLMDD